MQGRKKIEKLTVLLFTMMIPVLLYLFLKEFGDNHFTVPVFYESGINPDTANCDFSKKTYHVDYDRFLSAASPSRDNSFFENKLMIIDPGVSAGKQAEQVNAYLERVYNIFHDIENVQFLSLQDENQKKESLNRKKLTESGWHTLIIDHDQLSEFAICGLILLDYTPDPSSWDKRIVLVDGSRRIRGYYNADDFDDIERLILEIKIILKEEY